MNNEVEIIKGRCKLINEEWRKIPNYPNYEVSNFGRVRSLTREINQFGHKQTYKRIMRGKILKPRKQNGGYLLINLSKDGTRYAVTVHRLVAKCFLTDHEGNDVNHKDGNKTNNCLSNLEYVTRSENIKHAYRELGHKRSRSKKVMCLESGVIYNSCVDAGKALNISSGSMYHALAGRNKTAGNLTWKYI
jgi:hypothetical protein